MTLQDAFSDKFAQPIYFKAHIAHSPNQNNNRQVSYHDKGHMEEVTSLYQFLLCFPFGSFFSGDCICVILWKVMSGE